MTKNLNSLLLTIITALLFALTFCFFFLFPFEKTITSYFGLIFCLFAEMMLFALPNAISKKEVANKAFLYSGTAAVLGLYLIGTAALFAFSGLFGSNTVTFVLLEMICLFIAGIFFCLVLGFSNRIDVSEQKISENRKLMQICAKTIYDLLIDDRYSDFKPDLNNLYEKLKFCDMVGSSSVDEQIVGFVMKTEKSLQDKEMPKEEITKNFHHLSTLISQRNMEMSEKKRGGF